MSLTRYPKYKDSGVEWLGEVPEHWDAKRVGYFFKERREKVSDKDYPALSVTMGGIVPQIDTAAKSDDGDNRKRVCQGDFVINSRSDRKGSSGASDLDGSVSLISIVLQPHEANGVHMPFVHHLLRSRSFQEEFYRHGKGIVADLWSTNYSAMRNILLAVPAPAEQTAIAAFLDRETAKIDALVAEQRRLMELLKEKRQAVISHAVTKGLDPDAPMKESGIEWLGEVPAHWEVKGFKRIAELIDGDRSSAYPSDTDLVDEGIPFLSSKNIVDYKFRDTGLRFITEEKFDSISRGKIEDGDLAITVRGTIGHVAIYDSELIGHATAFINAQMMIIRPMEVSADFIHGVSESHYWREQLEVAAYGTAQQQLSNLVLRNIIVVVPPETERCAITDFLSKETAKFDDLIAEAQRAIDLLQERRTALISAAVTGKIDVRKEVVE